MNSTSESDQSATEAEKKVDSTEKCVTFGQKTDGTTQNSVFSENEMHHNSDADISVNPQLYASLDSLETFMSYLLDHDPSSDPVVTQNCDINETLVSLDKVLGTVSSEFHQRSSSTKEESPKITESLETSPVSIDKTQTPYVVNQSEIPINDLPDIDTSQGSNREFEQTNLADVKSPNVNITMQNKQPNPNASSLVDNSIVPEDKSSATSVPSSSSKSPRKDCDSLTSDVRNVPKDFAKGFPSSNHQFTSSMSAEASTPFKTLFPSDEFPTTPSSPAKKQLRYLNDPPNIGEKFLTDRLIDNSRSFISCILLFSLL